LRKDRRRERLSIDIRGGEPALAGNDTKATIEDEMFKHLSQGSSQMSQPQLSQEIRSLPIDQRLSLVEQIWDSICEDQSQFELTQAQKADLDRRFAAHAAAPDGGASWQEVKASLLGE
jgi:putative addiction module component (TIGR02574 family)